MGTTLTIPREDGDVARLGSWGVALADLSREALVTTDLQFRVVSWPSAAEALLGWPRARAVGFGLGSVLSLSSSTMNGVREALDRSSQLKDALLPARRLGGVRCPLRANAQIVRNVGSEESLGIAFALSPMDEEGVVSQELPPAWIGRLMDCINLPVAVADVVGTLRYANFAARAQFGLEPGRPCCVGMCAEAGTGCRSARVLNSLAPSYWEAHSNGRRIDMTASPVTLAGSGPPDHVLYLGVPAQPHLSPELRKFFRAVDENLAGVFITDHHGLIEYANPQVSEILGYSPLELINLDIRSLAVPDSGFVTYLDQVALQGRSFEAVLAHRIGGARPVRIAISEIRGEDGEISNWVVLCEDISARKALEARERELQDQVAHSAQLAAVGEIASMIAHEINQPLTSIGNFGRGMLRRLKRGDVDIAALVDSLDEIVRQVDRAGEVVRNVRTLARRKQAELGSLNANQLIRDQLPTFRLLGRANDVKVEIDLDGELPELGADATQIEQVLTNLVKNAIEASASLGQPHRRVRIVTRREAEGARIAVEDRAPLPDAATLARLGEPFFTTKSDGLGLGLSISRTLLENHGARLNIQPLAEGGKAFFFDLLLTL